MMSHFAIVVAVICSQGWLKMEMLILVVCCRCDEEIEEDNEDDA